ncbi:unnamed protein product [Adineta steineri]|uniref:Uncharacterized protein n=1 Tax=Adineta steineri TaxID=433720 RepID=A0A815GWY4_9BILA|nr:unnamed protein product [Adineta steineri]
MYQNVNIKVHCVLENYNEVLQINMCSQNRAHEMFLIKKDYLNEDGNLEGDVIGSLVGNIEGTQPTSEFYVYCILLDTRPNSPTSSSSSFFRQLCVTAAGK